MVATVVALGIVAAGVIVRYDTHGAVNERRAIVSAAVTPTATPVLNPITISAMRVRTYTASAITTQRNLGELGGYSAKVVAFTSDGLTEYAYWAQPDGSQPAGGWPAIVLVHGYINPAQYNTVTDAYTSWIGARAGIVVVQPDLRGNGLSGGSGVSGHWDPDYTYDVMNLIASLRENAQVNPTHIGLVGHSMGGHVALNVAVISQNVAAMVLANGVVGSMYDLFYNWPNSPAPNDQPAASVEAELNALIQAYGTPKSDPTFWNEASAINYASGIRGPVQIDADEGDTTVPIAFSRELDTALVTAHKSVTMYTYPGNDHQLSSPTNLAQFLQRTTAFWRQTL
jgi:uncharacterized protein